MRKTTNIILLLLLLLAGVAAVSPALLHLRQVGDAVANRLAGELHAQVRVGEIQWHWLPMPHFSLQNTTVTTRNMELRLPETEFHPKWRSFLTGEWRLNKISLRRPQAHVKTLHSRAEAATLPRILLVVEEGAITLDLGTAAADVIGSSTISLASLNATIDLRPDKVTATGQASAPFASQITLGGEYLPLQNHFSFEASCDGLSLTKLIPVLEPKILQTADTPFNLKTHLEGSGFDNLQGTVNSDLPSFLFTAPDREMRLNFGLVSLGLKKSGHDLTITVEELELKEPAAKIQGMVQRRSLPPPNAENHPSPPHWLIDLSGEDMDLGQIRQKVLTLWGGSPVADKVCNIVRDGQARKANFRFDGPAADLAAIDKLAITVEVETAAIHVPGAALDLNHASGPIAIKQGCLTGQGLRAGLGNSTGQNGSLLLDLRNGGQTFRLDLDLDADLGELPPLLDRLVDHQAFRDELHRFSKVRGRAKGHLRLGERLDDIATEVTVTEMTARADYDRFQSASSGPSWPLEIEGGSLQVLPRQVTWRQIKGRIGPQIIHQTSGQLDWLTEPFLHIEQIGASLDASSLHAKLTENKLVPDHIADILSSIGGQMDLTNGFFRGSLAAEDTWEYQMDLSSLGLTVGTPKLPGLIFTEEITAAVTHERIVLNETTLRFLQQPLVISADIRHDNLTEWQGSFLLNGTVEKELEGWFRQKEWLPVRLFPRPPCTLHDLEISWQKTGATTITGRLTAGAGTSKAEVDLKILAAPDHLQVDRFRIRGSRSEGELQLDYRATEPPVIAFNWRGDLEATTLETLFAHNILTAGRLSGVLRVETIDSRPTFSGSLTGKNLLLAWQPDTPPQELSFLQLTGDGGRLLVDKLVVTLDSDSIAGQGQISAKENGLLLELDLTAPALSMFNLVNLTSPWQESATGGLIQSKVGQDFTARINFDIGSFHVKPKSRTGTDEKGSQAITWHDMRGRIDIAPRRGTTITIDSSDICAMTMTGSYQMAPDSSHGTWLITTDRKPLPLFQEVLPCMGFEQNMLEGKFSLQANLAGQPANWKSGRISIHSSQGRILRMKLLARIFSIVNITDLFDDQKLPGISQKGFPYSQLVLETTIRDHQLIIDRGAVYGEGLNMFVNGAMALDGFDTSFTFLIAPLKTIDALVAKVPLVGRVVGGEHGTIAAIPIGVTGNIKEPVITILPPEAIGEAALNIFKEALALPFVILSPLLPKHEKEME